MLKKERKLNLEEISMDDLLFPDYPFIPYTRNQGLEA